VAVNHPVEGEVAGLVDGVKDSAIRVCMIRCEPFLMLMFSLRSSKNCIQSSYL
jgi:hypothetical protein